jgi:uncharacterized protein (TIGR02270 family)
MMSACSAALMSWGTEAPPLSCTVMQAATLGDGLGAQPANHPQTSADFRVQASRTIRSAELCLAYLDDPVHGRLAGEAFSVITGLSIEGELERQEQEEDSGEPLPFEDDDLDADLRPGPDRELPLPRAEEVQRWWGSVGRGLPSSGRLLGGRPFAVETLLELLSRGPMRRRRLAALELATRTRGECPVETRTWAREQERALAALRLTVRAQLLQPFSRLLQA